jgi:hypothetical protein
MHTGDTAPHPFRTLLLLYRVLWNARTSFLPASFALARFAFEVRPAEVRPGEVRIAEVRPMEIRPAYHTACNLLRPPGSPGSSSLPYSGEILVILVVGHLGPLGRLWTTIL